MSSFWTSSFALTSSIYSDDDSEDREYVQGLFEADYAEVMS